MSIRRATLLLAAIAFTDATSLAAQSAAQPLAGFDAYVERVLKTFAVPGASVAIVQDGRIVLARGYGVKRLGQSDPVDANTRFGIGSNTKLFTATAIALLVEDGKLGWDQPVIRYLPDFAMYDPWVTREITVRDLLVHRSGLGLGAGDLLHWPMTSYERAEIVRRIRFIKPATSFRSAYAYDNVLYLVAGQLIEKVSGMSWEEFVRTRILVPVGMTSSTPRLSDVVRGQNVAATHAEVDGTIRVVAPMTADNVNPAGGVTATAADMARWMIVQMDSGRIAGAPERRLFPSSTTRELWAMVTPIPVNGDAPAGFEHLARSFSGYALGVGASDYRGNLRLQHSGGLPGYVSLVTMVPARRLGITVLTNQESSYAFNAITLHAIDAFLGVTPPDYLGFFAALRDSARARLARAGRKAAAARDSTSGPSLPLAKYAGQYEDAWYGRVGITKEGTGLVIRFSHTPQPVGDMIHWQHDTFLVRWRDRELRADAYATFALDSDGTIDQLKMAPASDEVDFSFDFQGLLLRPVAKTPVP